MENIKEKLNSEEVLKVKSKEDKKVQLLEVRKAQANELASLKDEDFSLIDELKDFKSSLLNDDSLTEIKEDQNKKEQVQETEDDFLPGPLKLKLTKEEKAILEAEKTKEKNRLNKETDKEIERLAKGFDFESEKENERLAKEKEKERLAREKEKEKERLAKEKEKEKEKERLAREKEKEKERLAKEKEKEKEKQRLLREKEKEKERLAKEKEKEKEKQRLLREKEKEKERLAKEKEKAKEKERLLREKEKEKERLAREKEKLSLGKEKNIGQTTFKFDPSSLEKKKTNPKPATTKPKSTSDLNKKVGKNGLVAPDENSFQQAAFNFEKPTKKEIKVVEETQQTNEVLTNPVIETNEVKEVKQSEVEIKEVIVEEIEENNKLTYSEAAVLEDEKEIIEEQIIEQVVFEEQKVLTEETMKEKSVEPEETLEEKLVILDEVFQENSVVSKDIIQEEKPKLLDDLLQKKVLEFNNPSKITYNDSDGKVVIDNLQKLHEQIKAQKRLERELLEQEVEKTQLKDKQLLSKLSQLEEMAKVEIPDTNSEEIKILEDTVDELNAELDELYEKYEKLVNTTYNSVLLFDQDTLELNVEVIKNLVNTNDINSQIKRLEAELSDLNQLHTLNIKTVMQANKSEIDILSVQISDLNIRLSEANSNLKNEKMANELKVRKLVESHNKEITELNNKINELQNANKELVNINQDFSNNETQLKMLLQNNVDLEELNNKLKNENHELTNKLQNKDNELTELKNEVKTKDEEVFNLKNQVAELENKIFATNKIVDEAKSNEVLVSSFEETSLKLINQIISKDQIISELNMNNQLLQNEVKEANQKVEQYLESQKLIANFEELSLKLINKMASKEAEALNTKKQIEDLRLVVEEATKNSSKNQENQKLISDFEDLGLKLINKLIEKEKEISSLYNKNNDLSTMIEMVNKTQSTQNQKLISDFEELSIKLVNKLVLTNIELNSLREEIASLKGQMATKEAEEKKNAIDKSLVFQQTSQETRNLLDQIDLNNKEISELKITNEKLRNEIHKISDIELKYNDLIAKFEASNNLFSKLEDYNRNNIEKIQILENNLNAVIQQKNDLTEQLELARNSKEVAEEKPQVDLLNVNNETKLIQDIIDSYNKEKSLLTYQFNNEINKLEIEKKFTNLSDEFGLIDQKILELVVEYRKIQRQRDIQFQKEIAALDKSYFQNENEDEEIEFTPPTESDIPSEQFNIDSYLEAINEIAVEDDKIEEISKDIEKHEEIVKVEEVVQTEEETETSETIEEPVQNNAPQKSTIVYSRYDDEIGGFQIVGKIDQEYINKLNYNRKLRASLVHKQNEENEQYKLDCDKLMKVQEELNEKIRLVKQEMDNLEENYKNSKDHSSERTKAYENEKTKLRLELDNREEKLRKNKDEDLRRLDLRHKNIIANINDQIKQLDEEEKSLKESYINKKQKNLNKFNRDNELLKKLEEEKNRGNETIETSQEVENVKDQERVILSQEDKRNLIFKDIKIETEDLKSIELSHKEKELISLYKKYHDVESKLINEYSEVKLYSENKAELYTFKQLYAKHLDELKELKQLVSSNGSNEEINKQIYSLQVRTDDLKNKIDYRTSILEGMKNKKTICEYIKLTNKMDQIRDLLLKHANKRNVI